MSDPMVSVIVPIYNAEKYISATLKSLLNQTLNELEYLLVDDCSTDSTINVIESVLEDFPKRKNQVTIIRNRSNLGAGQSRNVGIENSHGTYVIFCDSDDLVDLDAYESMLKLAVESDADMVTCGMKINNKECLFLDVKTLSLASLQKYECLEGGIYSSSCNKMVKRSLILENNIRFAQNIRMWDDLYFTFQLRYFCSNDVILDKALYNYLYVNSGSITRADVDKKVESQVQCVKLIETFLNQKYDVSRYEGAIRFLKLRSKDSFFTFENKERWRLIYPESHNKMYKYLRYYGLKRIILFYLYAYSNIGVVSKILELYSKYKGEN